MEGGDGKRRAGLAMETLTAVTAVTTSLLSSKPFLQSLPAMSSVSYSYSVLLRRFLLFSLRLLFHLLTPFLALLDPASAAYLAAGDDPSAAAGDTSGGGSSAAARALSHVLSVVARVPAASRKYELVRSLADGLLDDNLRSAAASLNRGALSGAFARTLRRLDSAVRARRPGRRPLDRVAGAVWSGLRKLVEEEGEGEAEGSSASAEKMAAELVWLAGKMTECGAAEETVAMWGEAKGLARVAWAAGLEPRVQVAFVRLSVFLFKHANAKQVRGRTKGAEDEEDEEFIASRYRMAMLTSWLPLLCRATNGTDSPILSSAEKAEMVRVLEEMIEKLSWDQQEEVLALWLQHFSSCPDSDWPNLESCYTRWYSKSRKLLLLK